jgi:hypothetical protein
MITNLAALLCPHFAIKTNETHPDFPNEYFCEFAWEDNKRVPLWTRKHKNILCGTLEEMKEHFDYLRSENHDVELFEFFGGVRYGGVRVNFRFEKYPQNLFALQYQYSHNGRKDPVQMDILPTALDLETYGHKFDDLIAVYEFKGSKKLGDLIDEEFAHIENPTVVGKT